MEIKRASEVDNNLRENISILCVDSFYINGGLKYLSKDKLKLAKFFSSIIVFDNFYVAIKGNEIAGLIAFINKENNCFIIDKNICINIFGKIKGNIAYFALIKNFTNYSKKFKTIINNEMAIIETVLTNEKYRKMGVATALIEYVFSLIEYKHYLLAVTGSNKKALVLYKKLGFIEINKRNLIFDSEIYMKYSKE